MSPGWPCGEVHLYTMCRCVGRNRRRLHTGYMYNVIWLCSFWTGSIINITAEYSEKKIHVKWLMPLQDQCQEIKTFIIHWNNIQKPEECHGYKIIKVKVINKGIYM